MVQGLIEGGNVEGRRREASGDAEAGEASACRASTSIFSDLDDEDAQSKESFTRMFMKLQTRNIEPAARPPGRKTLTELKDSASGLGPNGQFARMEAVALPAFLWAPALQRLRRVERVLAGEDIEGVVNGDPVVLVGDDIDTQAVHAELIENEEADVAYGAAKALGMALDRQSLSEMWHQTQLKVASSRLGHDITDILRSSQS